MGRILLVTSRLLGRRQAAAELGRRLHTAGHDVMLAGPAVASSAAQATGLPFAELPDLHLGGPKLPSVGAFSEYLPQGRRARLQQALGLLGADSIRQLLTRYRPDLLLIDHELHPHIIVARGLGHRVALFTTMFPGIPGLRTPPLDTAIVPGQGASGSRAGVAAAWTVAWMRSDLAGLRAVVRGGGYRGLLAALASAEGVDLVGETTTRHWQHPFSWHRLPLLVLQPQELDLPRAPDPLFRHLGHMAGDGPGEPDAAPVLRDVERARERGERIAYVAFGSMVSVPEGLTRRLWQAARALDGWRFIHALGGRLPSSLPIDRPANVTVVDWAPQRALLRLADVAVIHAGVNSLAECAEAGCPVLCVPLWLDQPGNAARATYHGIGLAADPHASDDMLAGRLRRLVDDPSFRKRAEAVRQTMARYARERVAEQEVARLLAAPP